MTTDNTQELDEILDRFGSGVIEAYLIAPKSRATADLSLESDLNIALEAILDWHNKQIEAVLEALREEVKHEDLRTISQVITARIDKLKESSNGN